MVQPIHFQILSCFSKRFPLAFSQINAKRSGNIWSFRQASPKSGCKNTYNFPLVTSRIVKIFLIWQVWFIFSPWWVCLRDFQSLQCRTDQLEYRQTMAALTLVQLLNPKIMTTKGFQGKFQASDHTPQSLRTVTRALCSLRGLGGGEGGGFKRVGGGGGRPLWWRTVWNTDHFG